MTLGSGGALWVWARPPLLLSRLRLQARSSKADTLHFRVFLGKHGVGCQRQRPSFPSCRSVSLRVVRSRGNPTRCTASNTLFPTFIKSPIGEKDSFRGFMNFVPPKLIV